MEKKQSFIEALNILAENGLIEGSVKDNEELVLHINVPAKYADLSITLIDYVPREVHSLMKVHLYPLLNLGQNADDFSIGMLFNTPISTLKRIEGCGVNTMKALKSKALNYIYEVMTPVERQNFILDIIARNNRCSWDEWLTKKPYEINELEAVM